MWNLLFSWQFSLSEKAVNRTRIFSLTPKALSLQRKYFGAHTVNMDIPAKFIIKMDT